MEKINKIMNELFAKDYQFALATSYKNTPSIRYVDAYYYKQAFYIVTYNKSLKVKNIEQNNLVAMCSRKGYSFSAKAYNIGHPLDQNNQEIRNQLIKVFSSWYFKHNNESDPNMCYLKIVPTSGFIHHQNKGYKIDFINKQYNEFDFSFDTVLTEE